MTVVTPDPRRAILGTDVLLADPRLTDARRRLGDTLVKHTIREVQRRARAGELPADAVSDAVLGELPVRVTTLRPVLNATGVVLHTNLGRAPLSPAAVDAVVAASGYVDIEFDLASGERSRRGRGTLSALRATVPEAGDALVVNNGAAALALIAAALAPGREIVISRGELIEIGDGFRIPELLEAAGARLREVGTTNRTGLADYADAISDRTALILKIHPSNFVIRGFTAAAEVDELAGLGVPVIGDIGSGLLAPRADLPDEPDAATWLQAGASLVTASGDKLLGGPQAGLILGDAELVARLRRHPLHRALRIDKLTVAALEATLTGPPPPVAAALTADPASLRTRTEALAVALSAADLTATVVASEGRVGGGGAPEQALAGWAVAVAASLAAALRRGDPAVVARVADGQCLVDLRAVPPEFDEALAAAIVTASRATPAQPPCT